MSDKPRDGVRTAAAIQVEELALVAERVAKLLRSDAPLPPAAVARALVEGTRMLDRLRRHENRLQPTVGKQ